MLTPTPSTPPPPSKPAEDGKEKGGSQTARPAPVWDVSSTTPVPVRTGGEELELGSKDQAFEARDRSSVRIRASTEHRQRAPTSAPPGSDVSPDFVGRQRQVPGGRSSSPSCEPPNQAAVSRSGQRGGKEPDPHLQGDRAGRSATHSRSGLQPQVQGGVTTLVVAPPPVQAAAQSEDLVFQILPKIEGVTYSQAQALGLYNNWRAVHLCSGTRCHTCVSYGIAAKKGFL